MSNMTPRHNSLVQFSRKSLIFKVQHQQLDGRSLWKTKIQNCKIICQFDLDTGSGKMKSDVEFNSTLDQQVFMTRKCNMCIRDPQVSTIRWKYESKNQFKRKRKRQKENKEKDTNSSFIRQEAASFIHRSTTSKPHGALNVDNIMPYDLQELRPCVQYEWRHTTAASSGDNAVLLVGI